ncbi:hypothetical protein DPMN_026238 [Dreissena polymorpha]|uniref:Uncharacterized protein n=2 Tax=Dreissena polymorpha TaxID=45954 RepID=A0A9D4LRA5_DREPO|nr:hypothetical protein DPMN_026238 [Dreissena polymorpha]
MWSSDAKLLDNQEGKYFISIISSAVTDKASDKLALKTSNSQTEPISWLNNANISTADGVYISMDRLNRKRRQVKRENNGRVFLLANTNLPRNETVDLDKFKGEVVMVLPQHYNVNNSSQNSSEVTQHLVTVETFKSVRDILKAMQENNSIPKTVLSEVLQRQPAIQKIPDLNSVELGALVSDNPKMDIGFSSPQDGNKVTLTTEQLRVILSALLRVSSSKLPTESTSQPVHSQQPQEDNHGNIGPVPNLNTRSSQPITRQPQSNNERSVQRQQTQHTLPVSQPLPRVQASIPQFTQPMHTQPPIRPQNIPDQGNNMVRFIQQSQSTGQSPSSVPNTIQPQLTMQRPTSSQRIISSPGNAPQRPLVRTATSSNMLGLSHQSPSQPGTTRLQQQSSQRGVIQQRRSQPQQPSGPPDPFTSRFHSGFQQGSTLLVQPAMDFSPPGASQGAPNMPFPGPAPFGFEPPGMGTFGPVFDLPFLGQTML